MPDVAIPIDFANPKEIATLVLQSAADLSMIMVAGGNHTTIPCALVRNDMAFDSRMRNTDIVERIKYGIF